MDLFGKIQPPQALQNFTSVNSAGEGLGKLLNVIFQIMIVGAGVYALFNIILAGYAFLSAGDDPKKMEGAWSKIYQSFIGLAFVAGAFVLAAIIGRIFFGSYSAIVNPSIPTIQDVTNPAPPAQLPPVTR